MPLFPAYASDTEDISIETISRRRESASSAASPRREALLLASDSDSDDEAKVHLMKVKGESKEKEAPDTSDFYSDTKFDGGNLPVTTLYYPGRPQYYAPSKWKALGAKKHFESKLPKNKKRRYYECGISSDASEVEAEVTARVQAYRRMLTDDPHNQLLWIRFIAFQEQWRGSTGALNAAAEAEAEAEGAMAGVGVGAGAGGEGRSPSGGLLLRAALLAVRARHLPSHDYCTLLRDCIVKEKSATLKLDLWVRLMRAVGVGEASGAGGGVAAAAECAGRALAQLRHLPSAYPHLLYAYGCLVRAAGLWELLVLLAELVGGLCFPAGEAFPPAPLPLLHRQLDDRLQAREDEMISSGLPTHVVWARVERARAEHHWRAPPLSGGSGAEQLDPQRAPHAADVAGLLLPVAHADAALLLCAQLLRLAKVPLLPATGALARAFSPLHAPAPGFSDEAEEAAEAHGGEALLPLLSAARRLPAAHPARAGGAACARRLVARFTDPPHYFSDDTGYLTWVNSLWEGCCEWASGERRTALLCWRMRWWHAQLLLVDVQEESGAAEVQRIVSEARGALKRFAGASPLPFALFARVEAAAGRGRGRGGAVAMRALRAAIADPLCPSHHRLFVARIVGEVYSKEEGAEVGLAAGAWATSCAALGRPPPPDADVRGPPPAQVVLAAIEQCRRRCEELEQRFAEAGDGGAEGGDGGEGGRWCEALLPGAGEWGAALVALSPPAAYAPPAAGAPPARGAGARYWEQVWCARVQRSAHAQRQARLAHQLAPLFPHNAFLALDNVDGEEWGKVKRHLDLLLTP